MTNTSNNNTEKDKWFDYTELKPYLSSKCCWCISCGIYIVAVVVAVLLLFCITNTVLKKETCNIENDKTKSSFCTNIHNNITGNHVNASVDISHIRSNSQFWFIGFIAVLILLLVFSIPYIISSKEKRMIQLYLDDKELEIEKIKNNRESDIEKMKINTEIKIAEIKHNAKLKIKKNNTELEIEKNNTEVKIEENNNTTKLRIEEINNINTESKSTNDTKLTNNNTKPKKTTNDIEVKKQKKTNEEQYEEKK